MTDALRNGTVMPVSDIPLLDTRAFCDRCTDYLLEGSRVAAYFAACLDSSLRLVALFASPSRGSLHLVSCLLDGDLPSLAVEFPQLQLFEREIAEQFGVGFTAHPWFKPVRYHPPFPGFPARFTSPIGNTDFFTMHGDEVHEVAVGPVHAGVIEPGHFRFQCHGETVYHLEISLGYQHRGIERLLIGGPDIRSRFFMESAAGDTTIGHSMAWAQAMESLSSCIVTPRAQALRAIALELERCANHIGDLGALAGDVGFLPTASFCGRIRGDVLNTTAILCGNRFGRSFIDSGGVCFDADERRLQSIIESITTIRRDFINAADLLFNDSSVLARFENTGTVSREECMKIGMVGPAARACGCTVDVRQDFSYGHYQFTQIPVVTHDQGDVLSRALVRYGETLRSFDYIEEQCRRLPEGNTKVTIGRLAPSSIVVSLVEGWRGQICHVVITDSSGTFARYKIVDPSFFNWSGLAYALRGQQISDFPLCNKSFNLSYCGYDL